MTNSIPNFYDPVNFEEVCEHFAGIIREYLNKAVRGEEIPVITRKSPAQMLEEWNEQIPKEGVGFTKGIELVKRVIDDSIHIHHPRYMGHQVCGPLPLTILCDMIMSMLNNSSVVFEMGQVATTLELRLTQWVCDLIGYPSDAGGIITSGGSVGNLTALLAARQVMCGGNVWQDGYLETARRPAILVSKQAHYCVKRAVQIMGLGADGAVTVDVDAEYRMDMDALKEAYRKTTESGRKVIAVVASGCTTATGTFDPINDIADFCEYHKLWLHVDGAHGAAALLSPKYRDLLKGIERADSVVWDLHKMLLMPSLLTAVCFRKKAHSYSTFAQEASYLFTAAPEEEWFNIAHRTLECTKPMLALKAYISLMSYGSAVFGDYITNCFDLAHIFADILEKADDFVIAVRPDCNIVCFRYEPANCPAEKIDQLQRDIRQQILDEGNFYIVQTVLHEKQYLRVTLINPLTKEADLLLLLENIRKIGGNKLAGIG